ncbi:MAG TPA: response regulator [Ramlibacter sp.]|jgi:two-component system alkaline phosphatase synthesis response regulator PhoP/two-component system response regulator VicR|nr:response regulator [Ramlibacter sp.]
MKKILVVDDEFDLLQTICATLELGGYQPEAAGNGREALKKLATFEPDLVLTDVMMPYMSGYELVEAIRKLPGREDVPLILMSAIDPAQHPQGSWHAVLPKPFTLEKLLSAVEALIGEGEEST